jgi:putative membrane protein insertion efficiency factor
MRRGACVKYMKVKYASSLAGIAIVWALVPNARPIALAGIHVYQHALSPLAARAGVRCRFTPSCSRYAEAVIARDGVAVGTWKALKRIARCGPWTPPGTVDEP